ncbi:hypothetical protein AAC387_Pa09g0360 [Persea americana]
MDNQPAKEELAYEGAAEGDIVDGGGYVGREAAGCGYAIHMIVNSTEQLGHERNAKEVVGIGKKAHASDYYGSNVVQLLLSHVENVQNL